MAGESLPTLINAFFDTLEEEVSDLSAARVIFAARPALVRYAQIVDPPGAPPPSKRETKGGA